MNTDDLFPKGVVLVGEIRAACEQIDRRLQQTTVRAERRELTAAREAWVNLPTIHLEVARDLSLEGQERVRRAIADHVPHPARLAVVVHPEIIAGAVLTWAGKRFDSSWAKKLQRISYEEL